MCVSLGFVSYSAIHEKPGKTNNMHEINARGNAFSRTLILM
jgi:hypothetical protein